MANALITPSVIAKVALASLDNELVMKPLVYNDYSEEFVKVGSTINVRKPVKFTVRSGSVMDVQDVQEANVAVAMDRMRGVDFAFSSTDLTLTIEELNKRYIRPAMIQLANTIDRDLHQLYQKVWNWVGTPGTPLTTFAGFTKAPQRLMEMAVPQPYMGTLSPADQYGMLSDIKTLYVSELAKTAIERAKLPPLAGVDTYATQNVYTHTTGTRTNTTPVANVTTQVTTYALSKNTNSQTLNVTGAGTGVTYKAGDVFTLGTTTNGVLAINPVTRQALSYLQQFVVLNDATADGAGAVALTISPAIIPAGDAYQTVSLVGTTTSCALTNLGTASTGYTQNMVFAEQAFAFVSRPLVIPPGAVDAARETYKGISARVIPVYDGINDVSKWRLDILYGVAAPYPDLATRLSGT